MNKLKASEGKYETLIQIAEELKNSGVEKCALIFGKHFKTFFFLIHGRVRGENRDYWMTRLGVLPVRSESIDLP